MIHPSAPDSRIQTAINQIAMSFVRWWGIGELHSIRGRLLVTSATEIDFAVLRGVLDQAPALRWLDDTREWFSIAGCPSGLDTGLRQVFGLSNPLHYGDLREAVLRSRRGHQQLPNSVLERYLVEILGATFDVDVVHLRGEGTIRLNSVEAMLVGLLRQAGGEIGRRELLMRAAEMSISKAIVTRLLQKSFLFLPGAQRRIRLIGHRRCMTDPLWYAAVAARPAEHCELPASVDDPFR